MVKLQELISLFAIFIALIPLSSCDSIVTIIEDEAVQLEFPYPCDSNKVTIQRSNRLPFYNSAEPESLYLPFYQFNRFGVTDNNCSVQVDINPVKRRDKAIYICKAYRNGVIQSRFAKIRLVVNYPPGDVSCIFSINGDVVGDWVPLQCMAPVGSLAGGIYCYQDSERLPPLSKLVQNGETLIQTIWARKEYPVFCCSSILDRPKDVCECKNFVWDPRGNISQTNTIIAPCPAITPGLVATLPQYPEREVEDNSQLPQLIEPLNQTDTNKDKSSSYNPAELWRGVIAFGILLIPLVISTLLKTTLHLKVEKANTCSLKRGPAEHKVTGGTCSQTIEKHDFACQTYKEEHAQTTLSSNDKHRSKSMEIYRREVILTRTGSTKAKSTSAMPTDWV